MSEQERGAYTPPTDEPLAFDARRSTGERRPVPMTLIASGVVLAVLVVAVVLFYRSGVRGSQEAPNVVGEPVAAVKTAPAQDAQPVDEAAGLDVYVADAAAPAAGQPNFAPAPEQPLPRQTTPAMPAPAAPAPTAPVTTGPGLRPAQPAAQVQAAAPTAVPAAPAPKPVAPVVAQAPAASGGAAAVQIGAFGSTAVADAEFAKVAGAFPQYTSGKAKRVEPVERDGKTLYRTAFTGFASKADAQAFCAALKAAGRACLVK